MTSETPEQAHGAAREYAWKWFEYHAGQRQSVFRFYLVISGAAFTGYFTVANAISDAAQQWAYLFGLLIFVVSVLFWRLDLRSMQLIKLSEQYLRLEEERLAAILNNESVRLVHKSEVEKSSRWPAKWLVSFRQIYRTLFLTIGILGLILFVFGEGSPIVTFADRCAHKA